MVRLEARSPQGGGYLSQRQLLVDALGMQPDRIIVGETRGAEALDVLEAMNTGCNGSMTTIHADSPGDALIRIENMVAMTGLGLPPSAVRQQIDLAVDLVIQLERLSDGSRRIVSLQEIQGLEGDAVALQEIFTYVREGVDENGMEIGELISTGLRPRFSERLGEAGFALPEDLFEAA
jgi:pilus assembly protein CpaF